MVVTFQIFHKFFSRFKFSKVDLEHNNLPYGMKHLLFIQNLL